ncbi:MAG: hypothetical protein IT383_13315 [Deltaproteobacteria bacterium]|nr:hypothetical protein [Deltaproteobacteria bacterium]
MITAFLFACSLASAPVAAAEGVADDRATKDDYELDTSATDKTIKVGKDGAFSLVLRAKNGKKVHAEAPLEVVFKDPKGVKPAKTKLGRGDVRDKAAASPELRTTLRGDKAGATTLEATVSFFLCTDSWCQRMSDKISVPVSVEP